MCDCGLFKEMDCCITDGYYQTLFPGLPGLQKVIIMYFVTDNGVHMDISSIKNRYIILKEFSANKQCNRLGSM